MEELQTAASVKSGPNHRPATSWASKKDASKKVPGSFVTHLLLKLLREKSEKEVKDKFDVTGLLNALISIHAEYNIIYIVNQFNCT